MSYLLDEIRRTIRNSEQTRYRIAKESGMSQGQLSRLMTGERGLSVESIELLAEYLGLEILVRPKRHSRKGR